MICHLLPFAKVGQYSIGSNVLTGLWFLYDQLRKHMGSLLDWIMTKIIIACKFKASLLKKSSMSVM